MPEKTKQNGDDKVKQPKNNREESQQISDENNWSRDQQKKSYYYDDSYGYEIYTPDEDDKIEVEDEG